MIRVHAIANRSGATHWQAVLATFVCSCLVHLTVHVIQNKLAEAHERDPAGAVWYGRELAGGSHLALPTVPYRGTLAAYLAGLSPTERTAWWDGALGLADDGAAFVAAQKRLSAARAAAGGAGPDPFRSSAAPGPALLTVAIVWEAAANLAEDAGQRGRAQARWQVMADARHADAMRWWDAGTPGEPGSAREGSPPTPPVMPTWTVRRAGTP
jgi:hypothetical protein